MEVAQKAEKMILKIIKKCMIVQCATFSKSLNHGNIEKSVSDIRIRIRFLFEGSFWISVSGCKLTILPDIQPANRIVIISVRYIPFVANHTFNTTLTEWLQHLQESWARLFEMTESERDKQNANWENIDINNLQSNLQKQHWAPVSNLSGAINSMLGTMFWLIGQRWAGIRTGSDWIRTEANFGQIRMDRPAIFSKLADQDWIGLRKFLLFQCDYSENLNNFSCDPNSQVC